MTLTVPQVGEVVMLQLITNFTTSPQNLLLKLFVNNITPAHGDTAGTYTEASGNGYAAITLTGATWTVVGGNPSIATYPQQTFTFTGALGNVYGYYIVQSGSGILMWSEAFTGGPFNIVNNGDQVKISPAITLL